MNITISDEMYNELVNNESSYVRCIAAKLGIGLDTLMNDESDIVRKTVAEQGHALDVLARDESQIVRLAVVNMANDEILNDILQNEKSDIIIQTAKKRLSEFETNRSDYVRYESKLNEILERFDFYYDKLYDNGDYCVPQYDYDMAMEYTEMLVDKQLDFIAAFNDLRGDFISSDREYVALSYALADIDPKVKDEIQDTQMGVYLDNPELVDKYVLPSNESNTYICNYTYNLGQSQATGELLTATVTGKCFKGKDDEDYTFTVMNSIETNADSMPNIFFMQLQQMTQHEIKEDFAEYQKTVKKADQKNSSKNKRNDILDKG